MSAKTTKSFKSKQRDRFKHSRKKNLQKSRLGGGKGGWLWELGQVISLVDVDLYCLIDLKISTTKLVQGIVGMIMATMQLPWIAVTQTMTARRTKRILRR